MGCSGSSCDIVSAYTQLHAPPCMLSVYCEPRPIPAKFSGAALSRVIGCFLSRCAGCFACNPIFFFALQWRCNALCLVVILYMIAMIVFCPLSIPIHLFLLATSGYLSNIVLANVSNEWRWMIGLGAAPAFIIMLSLLVMPESPRWLMMQGRTAEAEAALRLVYPEYEVSDTMAQIQSVIDIGMWVWISSILLLVFRDWHTWSLWRAG